MHLSLFPKPLIPIFYLPPGPGGCAAALWLQAEFEYKVPKELGVILYKKGGTSQLAPCSRPKNFQAALAAFLKYIENFPEARLKDHVKGFNQKRRGKSTKRLKGCASSSKLKKS